MANVHGLVDEGTKKRKMTEEEEIKKIIESAEDERMQRYLRDRFDWQANDQNMQEAKRRRANDQNMQEEKRRRARAEIEAAWESFNRVLEESELLLKRQIAVLELLGLEFAHALPHERQRSFLAARLDVQGAMGNRYARRNRESALV